MYFAFVCQALDSICHCSKLKLHRPPTMSPCCSGSGSERGRLSLYPASDRFERPCERPAFKKGVRFNMTSPTLSLVNFVPVDPLSVEVSAIRYKRHDAKPFGAERLTCMYSDLLGIHSPAATKEAKGGFGFFTLKEGVDADFERTNEAVDTITALVYDFDDVKDLVRDTLLSVLQQRKIAFVYFTTHSHRKNGGLCRFRILIPIEKPYAARWHEYVYMGVFEELWGQLKLNKKELGVDDKCKNAARYFYALAAPPEMMHEATLKGYPGRLFDVQRYLLIEGGRHSSMGTAIARLYHFHKDKEKVHEEVRRLNNSAPQPLPESEMESWLDWADKTFIDVVEQKQKEDEKKRPKIVLLNEFFDSKLIYQNARSGVMFVDGEEVTDNLLTRHRIEFAEQYDKDVDTKKDIRAVIKVKAAAKSRDFFIELLEEIENEKPWDGVDYASQWFNYVKHDPIEESYFNRFGVALIARQYQPNIDVQIQFTLFGAPNIGKSEVFKVLTFDHEEWIADVETMKVDQNTFYELAECAIAVVEEFDRTTRTHKDAATTKHEQTSHKGRITLKYDAFATKIVKRHVLAATTNVREFLKDTTGNRRNIVLELEDRQPDMQWWRDNVRNLYRQWLFLYRAGYRFTLTKEEADKVTEVNKRYLYISEFQADVEDAIAKGLIKVGTHKEEMLSAVGQFKLAYGQLPQLNAILGMYGMCYGLNHCPTHNTTDRHVRALKTPKKA